MAKTEYEKVMEKLEEKFEGAIRSPHNYPDVIRIPSGSPSMDQALGKGIPINRWTRFWGDQQSGKTLSAWNFAYQAQNIHKILPPELEEKAKAAKKAGDKELSEQLTRKRDYVLETWPNGMTVAFYNVENGFDPDFARKKGIDFDKLEIIDHNTIEYIGEIMENLLPFYHFHIIDSTSAAITLDEQNAESEQQLRGIEARRWSSAFRRVNARWNDFNTGLVIEQVRVNQGRFQSKIEPKGGKYAGHMPKMQVQFSRGSWLYKSKQGFLSDNKDVKEDALSDNREPDGMEVVVYVDKNQVGKPFRSARVRLDTDTAKWDIDFELLKAAIYYGKYSKAGAWYAKLDDEGNKVENFQGELKVKEYWESHPEEKEELIKIIDENTRP